MQIADPTKSTINRCAHGCYSPWGKSGGTDNTLCSCCNPVEIPYGHRYIYARDDNGAFKKIEDLG
jgi:hypothetical protein